VPAETAGIPLGQSVLAHGAAQESNLPSLGLPDLTGFEGLHEPAPSLPHRIVEPSPVRLGAVRSAQVGRKFYPARVLAAALVAAALVVGLALAPAAASRPADVDCAEPSTLLT
jgi:hypothetical protein